MVFYAQSTGRKTEKDRELESERAREREVERWWA